MTVSNSFNIQPKIENLEEKKLIGKRLTMSMANNSTSDLWKSFIPRLGEISNKVSNELISMQIYGPTYFTGFDPASEFEKWATVVVTDFNHVPEDMETFTLTGGLYAVFDYKGSSNDNSIFQYIFRSWIPDSDYFLDHRPHFEVLGARYKNADPNSEEEIWIPIKPR